MLVGIDATSWDNPRGYGRFARNAVERLVALDTSRRYVMVGPPPGGPSLPAGAEVLRLREGTGVPRAADAARPPSELVALAYAARRARVDALLFPSVYTWFPSPGVPAVVGVHDVIADTLPELTLPSRRARVLWRAKETAAVRMAARVFTVSEAARAVVTARWRLEPASVAVVPEAPAPVFFPRAPSDVEAARAEVALAPGEPFVLFAGGISPHKNLQTALAAVAGLGAGRCPRLVAVGDTDDDRFLSSGGSVRDHIAALGIPDRVLLPGFVSDETLARLYSGAAAVVIPSLAEGFGLPAVEAAACGAALVLSDVPAHRETLDGAARFVAPRDARAVGAALAELVADGAAAAELGGRARRQVAHMNWDAAAHALTAVLDTLDRGAPRPSVMAGRRDRPGG